MATNFDFSDKVIIVTGASSGIGQATAILFAKKGASVVLCGRDETRLKSSVDQCVEASGGNAKRFTSVIGDVTKPEVREAIIDKAVDTFQRLDILVANAGIMLAENGIGNTTGPMFDQLFDTNVKAAYFLIQSALPHLEKSGGNIVNVSSISGRFPFSRFSIYSMTKAAIDHMTRCIAIDLGPKGIRVNSVNPSYIPTGIIRYNAIDGKTVEETAQLIAESENQKTVVQGKCVTAEAVADAIAFLSSDAAKFITGQCHTVDAGRIVFGSM